MEQKTEQKWYFSTVFISILFALWPIFGIPLAIGIILLVCKKLYEKKQTAVKQAEVEELKTENEQLKSEVASLSAPHLLEYSEKLTAEIQEKRNQIVALDDEILVQECGLYAPQFQFASALDYKEELAKIRKQQKELIKQGEAVLGATNWTVGGNAKQGAKMVSDTSKLLLRAFNSECDEIVEKVKYTNYDASLNRIYKSAETISKLGTIMKINITPQYIDAKVKELRLAYEYQLKKQEEKEAKREALAEQREQAKAAREMEAERKKLEKEQTHYQVVLEKTKSQLAANPDDSDLQEKAKQLEDRLEDIDKAITDVDYRAANLKAGYVYVISNIGSFGENVYKIGMTRRLDPQDRVDELGDASVPFRFDVHAMIFSDDAPALEAALHREFAQRKVNLINQRREFFNVTLDEIKEVVKKNYDKTVEFIDVPNAEQYRMSENMRTATN